MMMINLLGVWEKSVKNTHLFSRKDDSDSSWNSFITSESRNWNVPEAGVVPDPSVKAQTGQHQKAQQHNMSKNKGGVNLGMGGLSDMLKEGTKHYQGIDEAVAKNLQACKQLADMTRTSLGPQGVCSF